MLVKTTKGLPVRTMSIRFKHHPGMVAYITCGDPNLDTSREVALAAIGAGADVIELGVPFSDPVADGPVIQQASERALQHGTTLEGVLGVAKQIREKTRGRPRHLFLSESDPAIRGGQVLCRGSCGRS